MNLYHQLKRLSKGTVIVLVLKPPPGLKLSTAETIEFVSVSETEIRHSEYCLDGKQGRVNKRFFGQNIEDFNVLNVQ